MLNMSQTVLTSPDLQKSEPHVNFQNVITSQIRPQSEQKLVLRLHRIKLRFFSQITKETARLY